MTPREISIAMRELERQEREEISTLAEPVREKYRALKNVIREQCLHNWMFESNNGFGWNRFYCTSCHQGRSEKEE